MRSFLVLVFALTSASPLASQQRPALSNATRAYVTVDAPTIALVHARLIDGTGGPVASDQTVLISAGKIASVGSSERTAVPAGALVVDLTGKTLTPGFVGMHEHTYFMISPKLTEMSFTGPRLYLAGGVTTIRTTGAQFPYAEINMRRAIDLGEMPGPRMHITGPYLDGVSAYGSNDAQVASEAEARRVVAYWAEEGATWLKFLGTVSRAVLGAAIQEAHKRGMKVTGHLCSVSFREAAALGIDNLEHGLITNSDYIPDKKPDVCPPDNMVRQVEVDVYGEAVKQTFRDLIAHHTAMTSTLSVYELFVPGRAPLQQRVLDAMSPDTRAAYLASREELGKPNAFGVRPELFAKMLHYDREFVRAGGLLVAGVDPWGNGSLPGYGDQRNYELLIEAGFTPSEAIRVMTLNGATLLGVADRLGSVTPGKLADLVVIDGDPTRTASDITKVSLVFKDGVGYDSQRLIADIRGQVGIR